MRFKKIITILIWLCLGVTILSLFVFINLPGILESQIKKRLPEFLNPNEIEFTIDKFGFSNTIISKIRINKAIFIDAVNVEYTMTDMKTIHIGKITLSGLRIHADLDANNHITIQGLKFPQSGKTKDIKSGTFILPFLPEKVVLKNSRLILHALNARFFIPFTALSTLGSKDGKIDAKASLYPFGEKIDALVTYDIRKGIQSLEVDGRSFLAGHLNPLISKIAPALQLKGSMDFHLKTASPQKKWRIEVSSIGLVKPVAGAIRKLSSVILIDHKTVKAHGTFNISHPLIPETQMDYALTLDLKNISSKGPLFQLKIKNTTEADYEIGFGSNAAGIKRPQFDARFSGTPLKNKGRITFGFKQASLWHQKEKLSFEDARITSDIRVDFTDKGNGFDSKWALTATNILFKSEELTSSFPSAIVSGKAFMDKNNTPFVNMTIKAFDGKVFASKYKTSASGIRIDLPVSYPDPSGKLYGTYVIPSISYNHKYHFSTKGQILQTGKKKFNIMGQMAFKPMPDVKTQFKSSIDFEKEISASLDFKINPVRLRDADIQKITGPFPQAADIDMTASIKGKAAYINRQVKSSLRLTVRDGKITLPDANFTAAGIHTIIDLNDLMVPESIPGQLAGIDSIKINDIQINDVKIRFSIEDARSLLVENMKFKWCNGLVSSESIRFPQAGNVYSLILYCDRLELTQLLKQIGAFHAEGTGTLNGRIPVFYSDGNIEFDNGFLFSTPGSGGKIVVENTDRLTAGIPMDSPQFVHLDLAREALKDFDYKWAKLLFHTFDDTLFVNMELDGKPSKLLPFEYKKEIGGFIRVDASSPGSHFQGIKLDVNLKLPFNEVMKFGNKVKSIFN